MSLPQVTPASRSTSRETDPEVASVKQVLRLLDRVAKSVRTYGAGNAVTLKFFAQFYEELTKHLGTYSTLIFLVQRSELHFRSECVYATEEAFGENLAFRLYSDGIRELTFLDGIGEEDVRAFLEALWGAADGSDADDDIVTRIWSKNLTTITVVTAEELVKASVETVLFQLDEQGHAGSTPTSLKHVVAGEKGRARGEGGSGSGSSQAGGQSVVGSIGYDVSDEEMQKLAAEVRRESEMDHTMQVLEMLKAILASERSSVLLSRAIEIFSGVTETLLRGGNWMTVVEIMAVLREMAALSEALDANQREQIQRVLAESVHPDRLKLIELALNRDQQASMEGLSDYLQQLTPEAVPALCAMLGNLQSAEHRMLVSRELAALAKDHPDPLLRALTDKRPQLVKAVLGILTQWNDPRYVEAVEKLVRYPDAAVRREVLRVIVTLRPKGNGNRLVTFVSDDDEMIRLNALKILGQGAYTTSFEVWEPVVHQEAFGERSSADKRAIYASMRASAGDEAVPYWQALLADWGWTGRGKKEELALLAVDALGRLGSPAARLALEHGQRKGNSTIRDACKAALAAPIRQGTTRA